MTSLRRKLTLVIVCALGFAGCAYSEGAPPPRRAEAFAQEIADDDARSVFRELGVEGAFVLLDETRAVRTVVAPELASAGFLPASTFKIPNTLIGLETGVIPDERFTLAWDGQLRDVAEWNRDQDLASAMKFSVVWFYQEIARRIGEAKMAEWVRRFEYGNRDISGGIDRFWLEGNLRITPRQQVEFLRRLHSGELPVTRAHAQLLFRLIELERVDGTVWRGKTGLTVQGDRAVGWLVGLVERGLDRFAYALLVLAPKEKMNALIPMRRAIAKRLLSRYGVLPSVQSRSGATGG